MISLFKSNQPLVAILFPLIAACYGVLAIFGPGGDLLVDLGLWGTFALSSDWMFIFTFTLIIAFNAFSLNSLFNQNDFLERNTYVVGLIYIIGGFVMPIWENPGLILFHFFDIQSFRQLFHIKQNEDARKSIFNGAFLLACGLTFFPHAFPVVLFPFISLLVIRPFVWREYALSLVGLAIPALYGWAYLTLILKDAKLERFFWDQAHALSWSWEALAVFLSWMVLLVTSFLVIQKRTARSGLRLKRLIILSWISVFLLIASEFVHFFNQKEYVMISQAGTAILVGIGLSLARHYFIYHFILYALIVLAGLFQLGIKLF
jgi:hypothetical protein